MALPIRQTKQKPIRQTKPETEVIDRARPNGILGSMLYNNILPKPSEERPLNADNLEQITESNPEAVQEALPNTPIAEEARQITNDSDARNDEVNNQAVESTIEQLNSPYDDISDEEANNLDEITANDPDINAGGKFDINDIANQDAQLMRQIFNIPIAQEEIKPTEETIDEVSDEVSEEIPEEADNKKSTLADILSAINVGGAVSGSSISKAPVSSASAAVPASTSANNNKSSTISGSSIGGNNISKSISSPSISASANASSTESYSPIVNRVYNKAGTINSPKLQNKAISTESTGHNELKSSVTNGTFGSGSRIKSKTLSVRNNNIPQEDETHTASYSNNNITNTDIQNAMISNNIREHIIRASRTWILDDYGFRNSGSKLDPITIRVKGSEIIVNGNGIRNKPFDSLNNNELKLLSSYI